MGGDGDAVLQHHRKLQAVTRYTHMKRRPERHQADGLRGRVVPGRGDEFDELYLGANYFFYGHRLKVQAGVQFADMNDSANDGGECSGVSWTTGFESGGDGFATPWCLVLGSWSVLSLVRAWSSGPASRGSLGPRTKDGRGPGTDQEPRPKDEGPTVAAADGAGRPAPTP